MKWLQHQYAVQIIGGVAAAAIFAIGVAIWHAATTDSPSDTSANPAHGPSPFLSSPTVEPSRSNPSTSSSTAATTSTSPTNVPSAVYYLADLTTANPSDGPPNTGLAHIGGAAYPHSIWTTNFAEAAGQGVVEYDLQRHCSTLQYTAGITDDQPTNSQERFEVYGDGRLLTSADVAFGNSQMQSVDTTNVLRLRLVSTLTAPVTSTAAWGDAHVTCSELP